MSVLVSELKECVCVVCEGVLCVLVRERKSGVGGVTKVRTITKSKLLRLQCLFCLQYIFFMNDNERRERAAE